MTRGCFTLVLLLAAAMAAPGQEGPLARPAATSGRPGELVAAEKINPRVRELARSGLPIRVFIVLVNQPQKAIFERAQGASRIRRQILEGRYQELARQTLPSPQALQQAREAVEQVEMETRQAAFLEIDNAILPQQAAVESDLAAMGARNISRYQAVTMFAAEIPASALPALESDPRIAEVYPVEREHAQLAHSVPELGALTFWDNGFTGQGQSVAVFDTGVRTNHPAFAGKTINSQVFLSNGSRDSCFGDDAASPQDQQGHGTHVAGIVMSQGSAAFPNYLGVAKGISALYNVKVAYKERSSGSCAGPSSTANTDDVLAGLDWLVRNTPVKVVNYSFGGVTAVDDSFSARQWDQFADTFGLAVAIAAGNNGPAATTVDSPGTGYNMVTVGYWISRGTMNGQSSRGPTTGGRFKPDVAAPGTNILSAAFDWDAGVATQNPAFVSKSGTSMSTPHVAGSLALLLSSGVSNPLAAKAVLLNTTDNTDWAADRGWGYANLDRAWNQRNFATGSLSAAGSADSAQFYKLNLSGALRATATWNRHVVGGSTSAFNNVDLRLYDGGSGALLGSSATTIQNVEQVSSTFSGEAVLSVSMASTSLAGGIGSEPYALALSTSNWSQVPGPALSGGCIVPASVPTGQQFQVTCSVTNTGGLRALNVTAQLSLPAGLTGPAQISFGTLLAGASAGPVAVTVRADSGGSYIVPINITSNSFGQTLLSGASYPITVSGPRITTTSPLPGATAGVAYSVTLGSSGGALPLTWTVEAGSVLPAGLGLSSAGVLSGTPSQGCSCTFSVRLTDGAGATATIQLALAVGVPPLPAISITGLSGALNPADQPSFNIQLGAAYSLPVTVTVTLEFTPDAVSPADDPAIQFSSGGRTLTFTVPAGQTTVSSSAPFSAGTIAGTIKLTARLSASGLDITPTPAPTVSTQIARSAPAIKSVQVVRTSGGFEVKVTGYSTPRQMTQASFDFTATATGKLSTTSLVVPAGSAFTTWYAGASSAQFGSAFLYTQPFTVQGDTSAIASVSVTLTNSTGSSPTVSATF